MTTENKLKPCPFTGEKPKHHLGKRTYCQLHGDPHQNYLVYSKYAHVEGWDKESAFEIWNTRFPEHDLIPRQDVDDLIEALEVYSKIVGISAYAIDALSTFQSKHGSAGQEGA